MNEFLAVETGERAPQRLRRKALDLADDAAARLESLQGDDPKSIHEIRRRFKELRAMVRLVGDSLPHGGRPERQFFRDAGRRFAPQRDAKAALEAFDRLRERYSPEWTPRQFLKIRRALVQHAAPAPSPPAIAEVRAELAVERGRIAAWPVDGISGDDLWQAITRGYRTARRTMRAATREKTVERFHEWRRRAKVLWYHIRLFEFLGIAAFETQLKSLRKLSRTLGDHHDLVIIDELCRQSPESFGSTPYVRRFRRFLALRLRELEAQAESIGAESFGERPRDWAEAAGSRRGGRRRVGPKKSPGRPGAASPVVAITARRDRA